MMRDLRIAFVLTVVLVILTGIVYPLAVTGMAQVFFRAKANGSLVTGADSAVIGSQLLGQSFAAAKYFHGRPSAAGAGYDPMNSGASNLAPTNQKLVDGVKANVAAAGGAGPVPIDLATNSASGLDPDISLAAAFYQVPRVAAARNLDQAKLEALIRQHTSEPQFGFFGERRVNVLSLNLGLDRLIP